MSKALIQSAAGSVTSGTIITVTMSAVPTPGNALLLATANNGGTVVSVTQTNVTWTVGRAGGSTEDIELWVGTVSTSPGSVITITQPTARGVAIVEEWSGLASSSLVDQTAQASGSGVTISSGSITPSVSSDLIFGASIAFGSPGAPSGGYTADPLSPALSASFALSVGWLDQTAAAGTSTTWTIGSTTWDGIIMSIKAGASTSSGGGGTTGSTPTTNWSFPLDPIVYPAIAAYVAGESLALTPSMASVSVAVATTLAAYGWGNPYRTLLWVRDALNRYDSGVLPGDFAGRSISSPSMTVSGLLASKSYTIETWNTYGTGGLVSTQTVSSNSSGVLTFTAATITRDAAYKIYTPLVGVNTNHRFYRRHALLSR